MTELPDIAVWEYARDHEYTPVTRDVDFSELNTLRGFSPKIVWIRRGNCTTGEIEAILRLHKPDIDEIGSDTAIGVIELA